SEPLDEAHLRLTLFRVDAHAGSVARAALRLHARELGPLHDAECGQLTPAALSDWLTELLPSCFLVAPTGEVVLLDWFHLELAVHPEESAAPAEFTLRTCGAPRFVEKDEPESELATDFSLLDPALWSLPGFADLLAAADLTLSAAGRYLLVESTLPLDG